MKYLFLIYTNIATWKHPSFMYHAESGSEHDREKMLEGFNAMLREITDSGELLEAYALDRPSSVRTVRERNGDQLITDGPFAETKEQLAGYFVVECESLERALSIAGRFPEARLEAVEVRPIMEMSGEDW